MAMTINTNVASLTAQRNLNSSQGSLSTSMQRLSSGLRVNSAKDDSAGLAIAERMSAQTRGLNVAARNANDGVSLAQTAEGALGKVGDMLQRMRELAVQSANSTNSDDDRLALQAEVGQLRDEIDRVAKNTAFNGKKLLDGSFSAQNFQVGANSGENITIAAVTDSSAAGLSKVTYAEGGTATSLDITAAGTLDSLDEIADGDLSITVDGDEIELGAIGEARTAEERMGQVVEALNRKTADTGVTAFLTANDDGTYDIALRSDKLDDAGAAVVVSATGFTQATTGIADADFATTEETAEGIDELSVKTSEDAWLAIKQIDDALGQINSARANLGAVQSRFENAVSNIQIQSENTSAARGRIVDADFATETANMSKAQILQQAGTAMVAQANQLPQQVLSLLR
jgi:flagellin